MPEAAAGREAGLRAFAEGALHQGDSGGVEGSMVEAVVAAAARALVQPQASPGAHVASEELQGTFVAEVIGSQLHGRADPQRLRCAPRTENQGRQMRVGQ